MKINFNMRWIISGIVAVILGTTGNFVLAGTNSPLALVVVGFVLIIIGFIQIGRTKAKQDAEQLSAWKNGTGTQPNKKQTGWRIAALVVFCLPVALFLVMTIAFAIDMAKTNFTHTDFFRGTLILCLTDIFVGIILVLLIFNLKKALKWNKALQQ
jgi:hypothetical protein